MTGTNFHVSGTFRAAQYTATYPDRVGNFVLDSIIPHGMVSNLQLEMLKLSLT
jgi:pimeloyl-ACP methyl ester carboxylesterase